VIRWSPPTPSVDSRSTRGLTGGCLGVEQELDPPALLSEAHGGVTGAGQVVGDQTPSDAGAGPGRRSQRRSSADHEPLPGDRAAAGSELEESTTSGNVGDPTEHLGGDWRVDRVRQPDTDHRGRFGAWSARLAMRGVLTVLLLISGGEASMPRFIQSMRQRALRGPASRPTPRCEPAAYASWTLHRRRPSCVLCVIHVGSRVRRCPNSARPRIRIRVTAEPARGHRHRPQGSGLSGSHG
jgi:hypothetical protein